MIFFDLVIVGVQPRLVKTAGAHTAQHSGLLRARGRRTLAFHYASSLTRTFCYTQRLSVWCTTDLRRPEWKSWFQALEKAQ
jgi:hypothetical protein